MLLILILVTLNRHVLSSLLVLYVNITSQPLSSADLGHLSPARVPFSLQFFLIGVVFVIFYVEVVIVVVSFLVWFKSLSSMVVVWFWVTLLCFFTPLYE